jgi:hypothetical protein
VGSHFLHPDRNLHGRPSCTVELLYFRAPNPGFELAAAQQRVAAARAKGDVDVWLRVDYQPGQTLPPTGNEAEVLAFVLFLQAVAADGVLGQARGIIVGNEPNLRDEFRVSQVPLTPTWVARVVYGFGRPFADTSNAYQFITTAKPSMLVLAPAVGPWNPNGAGLQAGERAYPPPDGRTRLSPWERWQFELAQRAYDNGGHTPLERVAFAVHTYSRVGTDGTANGGAREPRQDVREGTFGAQFGTRWIEDCLTALARAGAPAGVPIVVSEWNCLTDGRPRDCYPAGLEQEVVRYLNTKPNVLGFACFVDQDHGGGWDFTSMTIAGERLHRWDQDHDALLRDGW